MRRRIWIPALALVGSLLVGLLLATPLAKSRAHQEASARGLILEMEDFELGWFSAEMSGVRVQLEGVTRVEVQVQRVSVDLALSAPRLRAVEATNGHVSIDGKLEDVRDAVDKWRSARSPSNSSGEAKGPSRRETLRNFKVTWKDLMGRGRTQGITGLNFERTDEGRRLGADLVEVQLDSLDSQVAGLEVQLESGLQVTRAQAAEMRVNYVAPAGQESENPEVPPAAPSPSPSTNGATKGAEETESSGLSQSMERNSARVDKLKKWLSLVREKVVPRLPETSQVEKLWVTYKQDGEKIHVGPSRLTVATGGSDFRLKIAPQGSSKGTPLAFSLTISPDKADKAASLELEGGPVSLSTLGVEEGAFGLSGVDHTTVSGDLKITLSPDAEAVTGGGEALIEGLAVHSAKLSTSLVSFPKLSLSGGGEMRMDGSRYQLKDGVIRMGESTFNAAFDVEKGESFVVLKASARAPLVSCQALLDSAPRGLLGAAERMKFDGTFSLDAGVEADTRELSKMKVRWDFKNGCKVKAVPAELDPEQFRKVFRRSVVGAGNLPIEVEFGPLSTSWTPFDEVSPYIEKALLVTEDGRFFRHDGFDDRAIESAIRDNVRKGKFVRGASTISMQLAKNLYLSRTKTLSRKFQEAALTSLLEQSFEKRELLELYVNIVEFGPGIYGIRQAAEHYFSSHPGRLSASQAFFLASILPAPTRQYFDPDGTLKEARRIYIHHLMKISNKRGAITEDELGDALKEELAFGRAETRPEGEDAPPDLEETRAEKQRDQEAPGALNPSIESEPVFPLNAKKKEAPN